MQSLIKKLYSQNNLTEEELLYLLQHLDDDSNALLIQYANQTRLSTLGTDVFMRGLIEFTNYCKQNCLYCGLRASNTHIERYRLTKETILACCALGHKLGYRTFVLQGGEDSFFTDDIMIHLITSIKELYPDCALTLSLGEKSYASYKDYYDAGADRYLLRHETASQSLYETLHPTMSFEHRMNCLENLKDIGYQVGAGFMVGLPNQRDEDYVKDLIFLKEFEPHMIGIGPFIPQHNTPLNGSSTGTLNKTITLLAIIRLLLPNVLLPATTALGSINPYGREQGIKAGANVVMPNLSPTNVREKYALYDGKICTGDEAAECRQCIERRITHAGFKVNMSRGDHKNWRNS
ncbi:iron-only hydrogenase maturation protein HydE [Natranaerovirga hydrolytica]|uniref:Iron-only hydrogenase maturation protein HydE n=1 Tax=Natranaerovirga hydrolytica TaxID=680378 RepID=A0A4R1MJ42_9FIRM|nr:[FeFe] hydrogenase H-cluster radical SAM maturase HydE [Natranaerovirga hydrolytica]TCK92706.1 iron-only hydrogenase maturation protein HydE [Natranaerovirga hydrolytica]